MSEDGIAGVDGVLEIVITHFRPLDVPSLAGDPNVFCL